MKPLDVVCALIVNNHGKVLIRTLSLRQINSLTLIGCVSFVSWPFAMFLGTFKSINFSFSFFEIISFYLLVLGVALATSFAMKNFLMEKEMNRKIRELNKHLRLSKQELAVKNREIKVLTNLLKQS